MDLTTWGPVLALVALALLAIASARGDRQASGALVVLGALLVVVLLALPTEAGGERKARVTWATWQTETMQYVCIKFATFGAASCAAYNVGPQRGYRAGQAVWYNAGPPATLRSR